MLPSKYGQQFPGLESCLVIMDSSLHACVLPSNYGRQFPGLDNLYSLYNLYNLDEIYEN